MGFDDQLWNHLVREHGADRLTRPRGSQDASALRDRPRVRRGRHGWLLAPGIAAVAAVAIATGALQGARHSHGISSRTAIRRAAAFITPPAGAREIVHVQATITRTPLERSYEGLDRNVASITEDVWSVGGANPVERAILHPKGGDSYLELNGLRYYDLTRHLMIRAPRFPAAGPLRYRVAPGRRTIRVRIPGRRTTIVRVSSAQLVALGDGRDTVQEEIAWNGDRLVHSAVVTPRGVTVQRPSFNPPPNPTSTGFAAELGVLLYSGTARVLRTTMQDGQRALQIYAAHPQGSPPVTYYVNPTTYAPIELIVHSSLSRLANTTLRFHTYQRLPVAGHRRLLTDTPPKDTRATHAPAAFFQALGLPTLQTSVG
jgi:hypothetical protein